MKQLRVENDRLRATFNDGIETDLPHIWLRDNCQCSKCFNKVALGRKMLLDDLDVRSHPLEVRTNGEGDLTVIWNDGHQSDYSAEWLYKRAFTPQARSQYRSLHRLCKVNYI